MVQRFGVSFINEEVFHTDIGTYVLYTDYAALEQRCGELEAENEELRKRLELIKNDK